MLINRFTVPLALLALTLTAFAQDKKDSKSDNMLKPANKTDSWRFEQHEEAKGKHSVDGDAIVFEVTNVTGTEWHVQAFQTPLKLEEGKEYILTFKAKADAEREVGVQAGIDEEPYSMIGLDEKASLTKEWKTFEYKFTASSVSKDKNRVGFVLGNEKGKVSVKEMVLKPA